MILQFLRQVLRNRQRARVHLTRPEVDSETQLQSSLSEYCDTVDPKSKCSLLTSGSDLELSVAAGCGKGLRSPPNLCSSLRAREFSCNISPGRMCGFESGRIPNCKGVTMDIESRVYVSRYSQDGSLFYVAAQNGTLIIYEVPSFRTKHRIHAEEVGWAVLCCAVNRTNNLMLYTTWSPALYLYRLEAKSPSSTPITLSPDYDRFAIFDSSFSNDSECIASTCSDGYLYLSDVRTKVQVERVAAHEDHANACVFLDTSGQMVITGGEDGLIRLWDRRGLRGERDNPVATFPGHIDSVTSLDARYDERYFLSNSKDQSAKLWDVRCPGEGSAVERTKTAVSRQNWDYRWERAPRFLSKLRLKGDCSICSYTGHTVQSTLIRAKFSPQHCTASRYVYTAGTHGNKSSACVYDLLTGQLVRKVGDHQSLIRDLDWHPYQMWLNTSSWDGTWTQWKYCKDFA